jgi:hypothetical protein
VAKRGRRPKFCMCDGCAMNRPYELVFNMVLDTFSRVIFSQHDMYFAEETTHVNVCVECAQEFI